MAAAAAAAAAAENKSDGTSSISSVLAGKSCSDAGGQSVVQLKGISPSGIDLTPKVRKPYTITKQREKWTEEEHQKFLEALKLYGRGWRQIEEHISTKTAVQIRSHAQKFFSKVSREECGSIEGSINPIEIPPPRPKRKPVHPYPRKFVYSPDKGISISDQPERSPSPNLKTEERENQSPTSVLSSAGSDELEYPVSEPYGGRLSSTSCTTDMHRKNSLLFGKGSEYTTADSSAEEGKGPLSLVQISAGLTVDNTSSMRLDLDSKDTSCTKEDATLDAPSTTIKLFGKTVLVAGSKKQVPLVMDKLNALLSTASEQNNGIENDNSVPASPSNQLDTEFSLGTIYANWKPWPCGRPLVHCMGFQKDDSNSAVASSDACLQRWDLYNGLPVPYPPSYNHIPGDSCGEEGMREKGSHEEISCTGSNTGSVGEVESGEKSSDAVDSNCQQSLAEERANPRKHTKGFVPYKRCLAEREISSTVAVKERKGQRIRVCL